MKAGKRKLRRKKKKIIIDWNTHTHTEEVEEWVGQSPFAYYNRISKRKRSKWR